MLWLIIGFGLGWVVFGYYQESTKKFIDGLVEKTKKVTKSKDEEPLE